MPNKVSNFLRQFGTHQRSQVNLSSVVQHTEDIGNIAPTFFRELLPTDKGTISATSFVRAANMPFPTLSNVDIKHRAFYVRSRNLWAPFDSFISMQTDTNGMLLYPNAPSISQLALRNAVLSGRYLPNRPIYWEDLFAPEKFTVSSDTIDLDFSRSGGNAKISSFIDGNADTHVIITCRLFVPCALEEETGNRVINFGHGAGNLSKLFKNWIENYPPLVQITSFKYFVNGTDQTSSTNVQGCKYAADPSKPDTVGYLKDASRSNPIYISLNAFNQFFVEFDNIPQSSWQNTIQMWNPNMTTREGNLEYYNDLFNKLSGYFTFPDNGIKAGFSYKYDFGFYDNAIAYRPYKDVFAFDFIDHMIDADDHTLASVKLGRGGKKLYRTFLSLGYNFPMYLDEDDDMNNLDFNFLPLAAYARVLYDYFIPEQFKSINPLYRFFGTGVAPTQYVNDSKDTIIKQILFICPLYDQDYFTQAWQTPTGDNTYKANGVSSSILTSLYDKDAMVFQDENNYDPNDHSGVTYFSNTGEADFTANGHKWLSKLQDWALNRKLFGVTLGTVLKNNFGIELPDTITNESRLLGTVSIPIQISDVNCTSDGVNGDNNSLTGDYAGKALANGGNVLGSFESPDYGYLIVVSCCVPDTLYFQGYSPEVRHLSAQDYYDPNFDGMGTQLIENGELITTMNSYKDDSRAFSDGMDNTHSFGFTMRFGEYCVGRDNVLGDYRLNSRTNELDNHYLARRFKVSSSNPLQKDLSFVQVKQDAQYNNYDKMFNYVLPDIDHFYCRTVFSCVVNRPMKSFVDKLPYIEEESKVVNNPQTLTR